MPEHEAFESRLADALRAYAAEVPVGIDPYAFAHAVAASHRRRPGMVRLPVGWRWNPLFVWALLAAALLATVIAVVAIGALLDTRDLAVVRPTPRLQASPQASGPPPPPPNVPDGDDPVGFASVGVGGWNGLVAANDGRVWARGLSSLSVYDPSTGATRVFGPDDRLPGIGTFGPAAKGGIWLRTSTDGVARAIRFDGLQHEAIALPADTCSLWDAGGKLLAASCDGAIARSDGTGWTPVAPASPVRIQRLAMVDREGSIWVIALDDADRQSLWRLTAGEWVAQGASGSLDFDLQTIAETPDGAVWVAGEGGLARYDGTLWRRFSADEVGTPNIRELVVAPDGTLWGIGVDWAIGTRGDRIVAVRYSGGTFTTFEVPVALGTGVGEGPSIAATADGVFASTWGALSRMDRDRFVIIDPGPDKRLESVDSVAVDALGRAWVLAGERESSLGFVMGRVVEGRYEEVVEGPGAGLTNQPDGTVWMATTVGPARLGGDRFAPVGPDLDISPWSSLVFGTGMPPYAVAPDGTPYVLTGTGPCRQGRPIFCSAANEVIERLREGAWETLPAAPGAPTGTSELAVAPDGALWIVTGRSDRIGLARFHDGRWESLPLPDRPIDRIQSLAFEPDGVAWAGLALDAAEYCDTCWNLGVGRFENGQWTIFDRVGEQEFGFARETAGTVVVARDGTVWANTTSGIARFDGRAWNWAANDATGIRVLTLGADGSIWGAGVGVHRLTVANQ